MNKLTEEKRQAILTIHPTADHLWYNGEDTIIYSAPTYGNIYTEHMLGSISGNLLGMPDSIRMSVSLAEKIKVPKPRQMTHEEVFEARSKGALFREKSGGNPFSSWNARYPIKSNEICYTPDYSKPSAEWEWVDMVKEV